MKVFIVCGNAAYSQMFTDMGWELAARIEDSELIQFCGGADVTPSFYGQALHPTSRCDIVRDKMEERVFKAGIDKGIPMSGICRGGQFLSVMCGGDLYQHVDGHTDSHELIDEESGDRVMVTSTHHQQMLLSDNAELVAWADKLSTRKESCDSDGAIITTTDDNIDVEALFYEEQKVLCFQPHPEFPNSDSCRQYYFQLLDRYLT